MEVVPSTLLNAGIVPAEYVLDGSLAIVDVSRRHRNHRVTWGDGGGVLLKQPGTADPGAARSLRNEAAFYAACARAAEARVSLPVVEALPSRREPSLLVLRLRQAATSLFEWRSRDLEPSAVYGALGRALGGFHAFAASAAFQEDPYVRALSPPVAPAVMSLHMPTPSLLQLMSPAQADVLRLVQEERTLGEHLEGIAQRLVPTTIVHGDLKADNVLVDDGARGPQITLIDWELAQRGDAAWDIGSVLQDALAGWLHAPRADADARLVKNACRAFWERYVSAAGVPVPERAGLQRRAIECSAAQLVRRAYELCDACDVVSKHAVTMLQVAVNLFDEPVEGAFALYGLGRA